MGAYVLKGRVIDSIADEPLEEGMVIFEDETITYVGPAAGQELPQDAIVIDAGEGTILPGFIDCHAHLTGSGLEMKDAYSTPHFDLLLNIAYEIGILLDAGFTGLRDMSLFGPYLKRAVDGGKLRGPRIMPGARLLSVTAGHGDLGNGFSPEYSQTHSPITYLVDGVDECIKGARLQFREGAEFIKICATGGVSSVQDGLDDTQFAFEEVQAIVEEAKRHGTYVAAHCSGTAGTLQALQAGVTSIEHGIFLDERCIELMVKLDATLVTTLSISQGIPNMKGKVPDHIYEKGIKCTEAHQHSVEMVREAGIRTAYGTDYSNSKNTPYAENGKEFAAIVKSGFTPMEAIKIGTINSAHLMKMSDKIGSLERGKFADVLIVEGNPIEDIGVITHKDHIKVVFKNGVMEKNILA